MFKVSRSFKRPAIENKHVKYKEIFRNTSAKNKFQFCEFICLRQEWQKVHCKIAKKYVNVLTTVTNALGIIFKSLETNSWEQ